FLLAFGFVIAGVAAPQNPPPTPTPPAGGQGAGGQGQGRGGQAPNTITVWAPITMAPERIDTDLNAKFREEGIERSKIMWIMHYLTDVYGRSEEHTSALQSHS